MSTSKVIKNNKSILKDIDITNFLGIDVFILSIIGFLLSRSVIIGSIAPLSIAFFMGTIKSYRYKISVFCTTLIGILFSFNDIANVSKYVATLTILMVISSKIKANESKLKIALITSLTMLPITILQVILSKMYVYDVFIYVLELLLLFIFTYIFTFGIDMITNINNKVLIRVEEAIALSFLVVFSIMGIGDLTFVGLSMKNILSTIFVMLSAIIGGASIGCSSGVIVGLAFMLNSVSSSIHMGLYSLSALIGGAFNKLNRVYSIFGYLLTWGIIYIYSSGISIDSNHIIEMLIASIVVMLVPKRVILHLEGFVNINEGNNKVLNDYIKRNTDAINNRLVKVYKTYDELGDTFDKIRQKNNVIDNRDIASIVDMIYSDECNMCSMKRKCWDLKFNYTYSLISDLLQDIEEKGHESNFVINEAFRKECLKPEQVLKVAMYYYRMFVLDYNWTLKFSESRKIIANQIKSISKSIEIISKDLKDNISINMEKEKQIYDELKRNNISLEKVSYTNLSKDEFEISIEKNNCSDFKLCDSLIEPILSEYLDEPLCAQKIGCRSLGGRCRINLRRAQKYKAITQVARMSKDGNVLCGDNYTYMDIVDGKYMVALSDGMGKGKKAYEESYITIDILEKMMESGIDDDIVINTINNMLILKSNTEEMFSTIDLGLFDLKKGVLETVKMGACATYIKRDEDDVDLVSSSSLPVGILSNIKLDRKTININKGDIVVMVSDGIVDAGKNKNLGDNWLTYFLKKIETTNPKDIADEIINKALELQDEKIEDDMTVLVTKVCD